MSAKTFDSPTPKDLADIWAKIEVFFFMYTNIIFLKKNPLDQAPPPLSCHVR